MPWEIKSFADSGMTILIAFSILPKPTASAALREATIPRLPHTEVCPITYCVNSHCKDADIGPKPIRTTKNIAHINDGKLLNDASRNRVANESPGVLMLFAANKERGSDITIPKTVI